MTTRSDPAVSGRSALEPPVEQRRRLLDRVGAALESHTAQLRSMPVSRTVDPAEIRGHLAAYDFRRARAAEDVVDDVVDMLSRWTVHTTHPRYFGLFNPTPSSYGVLADTLVAGFNPQLAAWSHAPAATEIEQHVLRFLGERLGLPASEVAGSFTSGGAEANLTGVLLALTRSFPAAADDGLRALPGQPVFYASAESHLAWLKIAHSVGLGRRAVRLVPAREDLRLDVDALAAQLSADRADGLLPFLVVATAGTTSAGVIDPLPELAQLCATEDLRLHVDAAWAGGAALSDRLRPTLAGIEQADSITLDAHKWMSVPMGAGMFLCTDPVGLGETFRVDTSYMPSSTAEAVDPYVTSLQWSRRFIGLKVFTTLAVAGQQGYADQVERDTDLGHHLRERLVERGWRLENDTELPVVCFSDPAVADDGPGAAAAHHAALCAAVVESGSAWISPARLRGRAVLRACITSYRTTRADVDALVDGVDQARAGRRTGPSRTP